MKPTDQLGENGTLVFVVKFNKGVTFASQAPSSPHVSACVSTKLSVVSSHVNGEDFSEAQSLCCALPEEHPLRVAVESLDSDAGASEVENVLATFDDFSPSRVGAEMKLAHAQTSGRSGEVARMYPLGIAEKIVDRDVDGRYSKEFASVFE